MTSAQALFGQAALFLKKHGVVVLIILFFVLEAVSMSSLFWRTQPADQGSVSERSTAVEQVVSPPVVSDRVLKISEIHGPRIDVEAAMTVVEVGGAVATVRCFTLPAGMWVFLLIVYVALLVFNLTYGFWQVSSGRPQWFWELLYTVLFIVGWYVWDGCQTNVWFPLSVIKMGVILYALYLYFFDQKRKR